MVYQNPPERVHYTGSEAIVDPMQSKAVWSYFPHVCVWGGGGGDAINPYCNCTHNAPWWSAWGEGGANGGFPKVLQKQLRGLEKWLGVGWYLVTIPHGGPQVVRYAATHGL